MGLGLSKKKQNRKIKNGKSLSKEHDGDAPGRATKTTKCKRKEKRQIVQSTKKESQYPRISEFPYTKPKLVLPRNRPPKPSKEPSYIKFSYNCFENNSYNKVHRYRNDTGLCTFCGSGFPKLESDLTNQLARMEQGPSGRQAATRRQEEMMQIRDGMKMCNKALHLRQAFNQNRFNDT